MLYCYLFLAVIISWFEIKFISVTLCLYDYIVSMYFKSYFAAFLKVFTNISCRTSASSMTSSVLFRLTADLFKSSFINTLSLRRLSLSSILDLIISLKSFLAPFLTFPCLNFYLLGNDSADGIGLILKVIWRFYFVWGLLKPLLLPSSSLEILEKLF